MNKYQRVINKMTKYYMQELAHIELMKLHGINNNFETNRKILKITTRGYSFEGLVKLKNIHLSKMRDWEEYTI